MLIIFYLVSILSLSQSANIIRFADAPATTVGFWRLFIASLLLLPVTLRGRGRQEWTSLKRGDYAVLAAAGFFFFLHLWSYFFAAQHTSIANCVIIFAINPVFTAVGALFLQGERVTARLAIAYLMAMAALWALFAHSFHLDPTHFAGDGSALVAAVTFSGFVLIGRHIRARLGNGLYTVAADSVAALFFFCTTLVAGLPLRGFTMTTWLAIAGLVVFPTLLGHAMFSYCLRFMNINLMSCGKLLEPVLAVLVALMLFHEPVTRAAVWAFCLSAASVVILFSPSLARLRFGAKI